jgi:hypothetical protein
MIKFLGVNMLKRQIFMSFENLRANKKIKNKRIKVQHNERYLFSFSLLGKKNTKRGGGANMSSISICCLIGHNPHNNNHYYRSHRVCFRHTVLSLRKQKHLFFFLNMKDL